MEPRYVNQVHLIGRVSDGGAERVLPSGDILHAWRVVVDRDPAERRRANARRQPDVIDVVCWSAATRMVASRLQPGDEVEIEGALRRRFFRSASGVGSRYEVEARRVRRMKVRAESD